MVNLSTTTKIETLMIPVFWMDLHIKKKKNKGLCNSMFKFFILAYTREGAHLHYWGFC